MRAGRQAKWRATGAGVAASSFACCVALAFSLWAEEASAYRTGSDLPQLAGSGRVIWADHATSFALDVASIPQGIDVTDVESALAGATSTWIAPVCAAVNPSYQGRTEQPSSPMDGVNTISWVTDWAGHGFPSYSAGSTDVQYLNSGGDWHIAEADIYLNAELAWSIGGASDTKDIAAVLTHEMGHALGLLHPCEVSGMNGAPLCSSEDFTADTMYPLYELGASTLAQDDIDGICYLYPVNGGCNTCSPNQVCANNTCVEQCDGVACMAGEICGRYGCAPADSCQLVDCTGFACVGDAQCGPLAACKAGLCEHGTAALTEACKLSSDCSAGVCVSGQCVPNCEPSSQEACASGSCEPAVEPGVVGCVQAGQMSFGTSCQRGEDCTSGICIDTDSSKTCTVQCSEEAPCPSGWECSKVDQENVCAKQPKFPSGGCSIARGSSAFAESLVALFGLIVIRRRKRRKS